MLFAPAKKAITKVADHPSATYADMVKAAIAALIERSGSSRQAIDREVHQGKLQCWRQL